MAQPKFLDQSFYFHLKMSSTLSVNTMVSLVDCIRCVGSLFLTGYHSI